MKFVILEIKNMTSKTIQLYENYLLNFLKTNNLCFIEDNKHFYLETGTQTESLSHETIRLFFHLISQKFDQNTRFLIFNNFIEKNINEILTENPENFSINFNSSSLELSIQQFTPKLRTYYLSNFSFPISLHYHIQRKEKMKNFIACCFEETSLNEKKSIIHNLLLNCKEFNNKKGKNCLLFSLKSLLPNNELLFFENYLTTKPKKETSLLRVNKFTHSIFINKVHLSNLFPLLENKEKENLLNNVTLVIKQFLKSECYLNNINNNEYLITLSSNVNNLNSLDHILDKIILFMNEHNNIEMTLDFINKKLLFDSLDNKFLKNNEIKNKHIKI